MKAPNFRAVEMARKIRDRQSRRLAAKSPDEIITFYRAAGEAAMRDAAERTKLHRRRAGQFN